MKKIKINLQTIVTTITTLSTITASIVSITTNTVEIVNNVKELNKALRPKTTEWTIKSIEVEEEEVK